MFGSQAYWYNSNWDCRHIGTIGWSVVNYMHIGTISYQIQVAVRCERWVVIVVKCKARLLIGQ